MSDDHARGGFSGWNRSRLLILRKPVDGRWGLASLYNKVVAGTLGIKWDEREEITVAMFPKNHASMMVFHADDAGVDLLRRTLYGKRFSHILEKVENPQHAEPVTYEELMELFSTGTIKRESLNFKKLAS